MVPGLLDGVACLIVEDDLDSRELFAESLELYGAAVRTATGGHDALAVLEAWQPDVVLCDLGLPDMDGYTLLGLVRARPGGAGIGAIALTGHGREVDRAASLEAGFAKHLVKPFRMADVVSAIDAVRPPKPSPLDAQTQVRSVLAQLDGASPCRFTSLLRFAEDDTLLSLWTYDRAHPDVDPFPLGLPVHASYCVLVRESGEACAIEDAQVDPRAAAHPKRDELACYVGAPLFGRDGAMFGTVCVYDEHAQVIAPEVRQAVEAAARQLESLLYALFDDPAIVGGPGPAPVDASGALAPTRARPVLPTTLPVVPPAGTPRTDAWTVKVRMAASGPGWRFAVRWRSADAAWATIEATVSVAATATPVELWAAIVEAAEPELTLPAQAPAGTGPVNADAGGWSWGWPARPQRSTSAP